MFNSLKSKQNVLLPSPLVSRCAHCNWRFFRMQFILLGYQFVTIATETDKHLDYNLVRLEKKINFDLFPYPQALPSCPVLSSGSCPYHSLPFCHFPVIHSQVARENCFFMGLSHRNQEKTYTVISAYLRSFQLV